MELDIDADSDAPYSDAGGAPAAGEAAPSVNSDAAVDEDAVVDVCPYQSVADCVLGKQRLEGQLRQAKKELERDVLRLSAQAVEDRQIFIEEVEDEIAKHGRWQIELQKDKFLRQRARLPIMEKRVELEAAVAGNRVVIVTGTTGCGKSTQVPQILYDMDTGAAAYGHRRKPVLVAQTRRIATTSIAARVALERGEVLGKSVGFTIGGCHAVGRRGSLQMHFVTMGVLMAMLTSGDALRQYSYIVLDEVHERTLEIDTALSLLRRVMSTTNTRIKLIIMSATMDAFRQKLQEYFTEVNAGEPLPVVGVRVADNYKVHYIDTPQVPDLTAKEAALLKRPPRKAKATEERKAYAVRLIQQLHCETLGDGAGILVFLPGLAEMTEMYSRLERVLDMGGVQLLCLHSSVSIEEQARVFHEHPGKRMIVLSTSIAESSLTVRNLGVVIDFCLHKENEYDPRTNVSNLTLRWASRAMCVQRAGRCGRQFAGEVHRLVTHAEYQALDDTALPEITTAPLQNTCLKVLNMRCIENSTITEFLMDFVDPPASEHAIKAALRDLEDLKLVVETAVRYKLTYFGKLATLFPTDVNTSVLVLHGYMYGCFKDALVLAAVRSRARRIIVQPFRQSMLGAMLDLCYAGPSLSDDIAAVNAYHFWTQRAPKGGRAEEEWCARRGLSLAGLREVRDAVLQLTICGSKMGLCEPPHAAEKGRQMEDKLRSVELLAASDVDETAALATGYHHAMTPDALAEQVLVQLTLNAMEPEKRTLAQTQNRRVLEAAYAASDELLLSWLLEDALREVEPFHLATGHQFALTACLAASQLQHSFLVGHAPHEGSVPISETKGAAVGEFYLGVELSHALEEAEENVAARAKFENQLRVLRSIEIAAARAAPAGAPGGMRPLKPRKVAGEPTLPLRSMVLRPACKRVELYLKSAAVGGESDAGWFHQAGYQRVYALRVASRLTDRRLVVPDPLRATEAVKSATRGRDGKLMLPGRKAYTYLKSNVVAVAKCTVHAAVAGCGVLTYARGPERVSVRPHTGSIAYPFVLLDTSHVGFGIPSRMGGRKRNLRMEAGTMVVGRAGTPELITLLGDPSVRVMNVEHGVAGRADLVRVAYGTQRNGVRKPVELITTLRVLEECANLREVGVARVGALHVAYVEHLKKLHERNMEKRDASEREAFDESRVAVNTWTNELAGYAKVNVQAPPPPPPPGAEGFPHPEGDDDAPMQEEDEDGVLRVKEGFAAVSAVWDDAASDRAARAAAMYLGRACEPRPAAAELQNALQLPHDKRTLAALADSTLSVEGYDGV